jgi:hypothetical protein
VRYHGLFASRAGYANPFTPAGVEAEREALGASFVDGGPAAGPTNRQRIASRLRPILDAARARLGSGVFVEWADVNEAARRLRIHRNTVTRSLDRPWLERRRARQRR